MNRLIEFFEDENLRLSMSRLLLFASFFVTTAIMLTLVWRDRMSDAYFGIFIASYTGNYIWAKHIDAKTVKEPE